MTEPVRSSVPTAGLREARAADRASHRPGTDDRAAVGNATASDRPTVREVQQRRAAAYCDRVARGDRVPALLTVVASAAARQGQRVARAVHQERAGAEGAAGNRDRCRP